MILGTYKFSSHQYKETSVIKAYDNVMENQKAPEYLFKVFYLVPRGNREYGGVKHGN